MQIANKAILLVFLFLPCAYTVNCQTSLTDRELNNLAESLTKQVENKMVGQNIAVADFVDMNDQPSNLGKYLAEEFSYTLVNKATRFKVIDRTQLRRLINEAGLGDKGMIDPNSIQKLGRLEGITAVAYGKLIPTGNYIKAYVKVIVLENQVNEITVKGDITRTPAIDAFLGDDNLLQEDKTDNPESHQNPAPYSYQHLQIVLTSCRRSGSNVDCELQITSINKDDNLALITDNTRLVDAAGNSYYASELIYNGKQSSVQMNQPLRSNTPVNALIRFRGVSNSTQSFLSFNLNCKSYAAFSFMAQIKNIHVKS